MKGKIGVILLLTALVLFLAQAAGAQEPDAVRFEETTGMLEGQVLIVEPETGVLILERNAIPYSFQITPATRITIRGQIATAENLTARKGQTATVDYRATRNGNMARTVTVR